MVWVRSFKRSSHFRMLVITTLTILLLTMWFSAAKAMECTSDTLTDNSQGEILQTLSGGLFETLAGDSITAYLWLPMSELLVCGPRYFEHNGVQYGIFELMNVDDGERVSALSLNSNNNIGPATSSCYNSSIMKPTPFMGTDGEVFVLSDGSVWQINYEYEYMYEYYPSVVACPNEGYVVVEGTKLNAQQLR